MELLHKSILTNLLVYVFPKTTAKIVYQRWIKVQRYPRPKRELRCFQQAQQAMYQIDSENVCVYRWGSGPPVLLIHGWNGRATQFFCLIESLVSLGYQVLSFDALGHGQSTGNSATLDQFKQIIGKIYEAYGEFEAIISHSFGFFAAVNILGDKVKSKTMIGISSPAEYPLLVNAFLISTRFSSRVERIFLDFLKLKQNVKDLDELSIPYLAKKMRLPCLIIHDEKDKQVPISEANKIVDAWPGAEFHMTKQCGHSRILRDQNVTKKCTEFLNKHKLC